MLRICAPSLAGVLPSLAVGRSVASAWRLLNPPLLAGPSAQSARLVPERSVSDGLTSLPRVHGSLPDEPTTRVAPSSGATSSPTWLEEGPACPAGVDTWSERVDDATEPICT
jgi:hypothetical protein